MEVIHAGVAELDNSVRGERSKLGMENAFGRTSARAEVTPSGVERSCDEQNFVGSAALGCIKAEGFDPGRAVGFRGDGGPPIKPAQMPHEFECAGCGHKWRLLPDDPGQAE